MSGAADEPADEPTPPRVQAGRLSRTDALALMAAFVLLFVMAIDWYGTVVGDEARRTERLTSPAGAESGELEREVQEDARLIAQRDERNAWQPFAAIDTATLVLLVLTVGLAILSAFLRAGGRRFEPPWTPIHATALAATLAALLVAYRTVQRPGLDQVATIKAGPPLALLCLAAIALSARATMRAEDEHAAS